MYRFDPFELDEQLFELRRNGIHQPLQRRVFDLLHYLIVRRDVVVPKEELLLSVWQGATVTEDSLQRAIKLARAGLGDDANNPTFILTVRCRGYRFIQPVEAVHAPMSSDLGRGDSGPRGATLRAPWGSRTRPSRDLDVFAGFSCAGGRGGQGAVRIAVPGVGAGCN